MTIQQLLEQYIELNNITSDYIIQLEQLVNRLKLAVGTYN